VPYWRGFAIPHLLQNPVDPLSRSPARAHDVELSWYNESPPNGLSDGLDLQLTRQLVLHDHIDERAEGRRHADALDRLDVVLGEPTAVQAQRPRNSRHPLEARWNRHVELRWHDVRQLMERQRCAVTVGTLRLPAAVVGPELPEHEIGSGCQGEAGQTVDAAMRADPVAGPDVVGVRVVRVAGRLRLAGCEEAPLLRSDLV
jgi:hypothetical protein